MLNRKFWLIIFVTPFLQAQFPGEETVWEGISAFYNYRSQESVVILERARKDFPEHPAVHLTWAAARYLDNQANISIETTYSILEKDLNELIDVYEALHFKYPDVPEYELFLGSAIGFRARVYLGQKQWIKTLIYAYRGFRIVKGLEKKHPDLADNYLPIGIVEYFAGISSPLVQYATNILGFTPTRRSGLQKIRIAADRGPYSWIEASSILSFITLWVENDPEVSLKYSRKLIKSFPDNFYFRIIYLESMIKCKPGWDSSHFIKEMESRLSNLTDVQSSWYVPFLNYEKALVYFNNGKYSESKVLLDKVISTYSAELDMILGESFLLLGKIYELEGNKKPAAAIYEKCYSLQNHTYAVREAERRLIHLGM